MYHKYRVLLVIKRLEFPSDSPNCYPSFPWYKSKLREAILRECDTEKDANDWFEKFGTEITKQTDEWFGRGK